MSINTFLFYTFFSCQEKQESDDISSDAEVKALEKELEQLEKRNKESIHIHSKIPKAEHAIKHTISDINKTLVVEIRTDSFFMNNEKILDLQNGGLPPELGYNIVSSKIIEKLKSWKLSQKIEDGVPFDTIIAVDERIEYHNVIAAPYIHTLSRNNISKFYYLVSDDTPKEQKIFPEETHYGYSANIVVKESYKVKSREESLETSSQQELLEFLKKTDTRCYVVTPLSSIKWKRVVGIFDSLSSIGITSIGLAVGARTADNSSVEEIKVSAEESLQVSLYTGDVISVFPHILPHISNERPPEIESIKGSPCWFRDGAPAAFPTGGLQLGGLKGAKELK